MATTLLLLPVQGGLLVGAMMAALWLVQRARRDAGVVDVGWAAGLGLLAVFYAWAAPGYLPRRALVGAMAGLWSFRLAGYLLRNRVIGKHEDERYQTLRASWGERAQPYFFIFFEAQAVLDVVLSLSFLIVALNPAPALGCWDIAGAGLWLVAVAGESAADAQLARHRRDPANRGKTCRAGLWRYSRHPNYFFEWLHWGSYALMGVGAPHGWLALPAPFIMLYFLFKVTGIPATEAQAVRSRGDDYRDYQRTTSVFIPWFPKETP